MRRIPTSSSRIFRTALVLSLALTFIIGAATPAMALSAKQKRVVKIIKVQAKKKGYGPVQTHALLRIAKRESTYRPTARNGSCKGLFQLMTRYERAKWANAAWNTRKAIRYIKHRYGSPKAALRHCNSFGWY